jgi:hypothetical protein
MAADKSLFARAQSPDNSVMTKPGPYSVTLAQWLAVLAVWGLAAYGTLAGKPAMRPDPVHLIACR